jgi:hypothetical protein
VFRCPFWRPSRATFGVQVCDNLVEGVPHCVVSNFYPDDPSSYDNIEDYLEVTFCSHFVWDDFYSFSEKIKVKNKCFFGGMCIHPAVGGFGACEGCSRFQSSAMP